jgi:hypothetical protein
VSHIATVVAGPVPINSTPRVGLQRPRLLHCRSLRDTMTDGRAIKV